MPADTYTHFVFVDFENVSDIDLALVEHRPAHVTLLIGKNQKKLDLTLVRQIHRLASQVELVEVGASGRNALDLTLAFYLGQCVQRRSPAQFHIVSKDQDFDPMIGHLAGKGMGVGRYEAFHLLPFLPCSKPSTPTKKARLAIADPAQDRLNKLIESFKKGPAHRPKKRATLLHHISASSGNTLSDTELKEVVAALEQRGAIAFDAKDKVSYAASP
jgi:hypothetical protein